MNRATRLLDRLQIIFYSNINNNNNLINKQIDMVESVHNENIISSIIIYAFSLFIISALVCPETWKDIKILHQTINVICIKNLI